MGHHHHHHPQHLCDPARAQRLLDPAYRLIPDPDALLEELGVTAGMRVVDLGAGPGFFSRPLLQRVGPAGKLAAVELQEAMVPLWREHVGQADNLSLHLGDMAHSGLEGHAWDVLFIAFTLHEVKPEPVLAECHRLLAPGGRLVALEWGPGDCPPRPDGRRPGPPMDHRLLPETLRAILTDAGFRVREQGERLGECQYWITATPTP